MYEELCSDENLILAFKKAREGKTKIDYVLKFEKNLASNLALLKQELISQTYKPKPLRHFTIQDPKTRKISKSRFRDRVIHHALINIIGFLFEKSFIYDSYANQIGKGTLKAIERFNYFKRKVSKNFTRGVYVLKADIKHYFQEVNHQILINILRTRIKDEKVIWLIEQILDNGALSWGGQIKKGMPLGNHTSQFFANVYLNELDQFVKHILKAKYYIRYVDDFVILHENEEQLEIWKEQINEFLKKRLDIELHQDKSRIINLKNGVTFLGFRIFNHHMLLRKANMNKFDNTFKELKALYRENQVTREKVVECLEGWLEYSSHANTFKYRREIIKNFNRNFPIKDKSQFTYSKKYRNFYRKVYLNKLEFSVQKTLFLLRKDLSIDEIAKKRNIHADTIWSHIENLIEHGQLSIWKILPKKKIIKTLYCINSGSEELKRIRERITDKGITYNEIACIRAHLKMKERISRRYKSLCYLIPAIGLFQVLAHKQVHLQLTLLSRN